MGIPAAMRACAAALVLVCAARAVAQEAPPQYLVAYRAYNAALEAGEHAAAVGHARSAWDAAEQELGDHRLTAILAFNYGRLVLFDDAEGAQVALQRARGLLEAGIADLAPGETQLYARYADFAADGPTWREADRLREALLAFPLDAPNPDASLAPMWLRLATYDTAEERFHKAKESAVMAERAILAVNPGWKEALAQAILLQGIAHLVSYPREVEDVQAAHNDIVRALKLFEPQDDIDSFDPLFAQVLAWTAAANAALHALGNEDYPDHEGTDLERREDLPVFRFRAGTDCPTLEWERVAPDYPRRALREGYIGAALIGYRLAADGTVQDARVLAEVPRETFGETALEAVQQWRVKEMPEGDPACFRNLTTTIQFVIDP
jgi:TonB family protein